MEAGDYEQAIETFPAQSGVATAGGDGRIVWPLVPQSGESYMLAGRRRKGAGKTHCPGLRVSQETGFELFEVYAFDFIGKAYRRLDDPFQASRLLEQALVLSREA